MWFFVFGVVYLLCVDLFGVCVCKFLVEVIVGVLVFVFIVVLVVKLLFFCLFSGLVIVVIVRCFVIILGLKVGFELLFSVDFFMIGCFSELVLVICDDYIFSYYV